MHYSQLSLCIYLYLLFICSLQCNGYSEGGVVGSQPAPIFATVPAGSQVGLNWTTWPDSCVMHSHLHCDSTECGSLFFPRHVGPIITYLARAPSDITNWQPGNA